MLPRDKDDVGEVAFLAVSLGGIVLGLLGVLVAVATSGDHPWDFVFELSAILIAIIAIVTAIYKIASFTNRQAKRWSAFIDGWFGTADTPGVMAQLAAINDRIADSTDMVRHTNSLLAAHITEAAELISNIDHERIEVRTALGLGLSDEKYELAVLPDDETLDLTAEQKHWMKWMMP